MSALTLKVALNLTAQALGAARQINAAPLTVAVLDSSGYLLALQREDGASLLRPSIAIGKAWGAVALGKGSRLLALDAQQRPAFYAALNKFCWRGGRSITCPRTSVTSAWSFKTMHCFRI